MRRSLARARQVLALTSVGAIAWAAIGTASSASAPNTELAAIKKAGVITIGMAETPPFEWTTSSGKWVSFNPVLAEKLAAYLHVKYKFVTTGWTGIVAGLQTGKYDIVGAAINATPTREKVINFSHPYYQTGTSFFSLASNPKKLTSISALNKPDVSVAVVTGSDNQEAISKYLPKAQVRALPNASVANLVSEVVSGRADALATSTYLAPALDKKYHFVVAPSLSKAPYGVLPVGVAWGVPKGQAHLLAKINTFLAKEARNGDISKLEKKWLTPANSLK
jgi:polar amino acid transport system substrate-binding protein